MKRSFLFTKAFTPPLAALTNQEKNSGRLRDLFRSSPLKASLVCEYAVRNVQVTSLNPGVSHVSTPQLELAPHTSAVVEEAADSGRLAEIGPFCGKVLHTGLCCFQLPDSSLRPEHSFRPGGDKTVRSILSSFMTQSGLGMLHKGTAAGGVKFMTLVALTGAFA